MAENALIAEKVRFLSNPGAYPFHPSTIEVKETHMAWVFLAGDRVFKLKKPVRYPYLDFSTLQARRFACAEELRLNREISPEVYLGLRALNQDANGTLNLSGMGSIVDWLVEMRRLPADRMLDVLIHERRVDLARLDAGARRLGGFYAQATRVSQSARQVLDRFEHEHAENKHVLRLRSFDLDYRLVSSVLDAMDDSFAIALPVIQQRIDANSYLEGHGDLRPEHICLTVPVAFIDRLEFNRELRITDPFDELVFLALECERLGSELAGRQFFHTCSEMFSPHPPAALLQFYRASRALLHARLALAHLLEPNPRTPEKWEPSARQYVAIAHEALSRFHTAAFV